MTAPDWRRHFGMAWRRRVTLFWEAWFPITAEKLRELQEENARLRAALGPNAALTRRP